MKFSHAVSILGLAVAGCSSGPEARPTTPGAVRYAVTFTPTWTAQSHPMEYPKAGLLTGPHFSGLIGAAHRADYKLIKEGMAPSAGLEKLSEEGKHSPLDEEIRAAMQAGRTTSLFETGPIKDFSQPAKADVTVDEAHPMVSFVAMIAPSPDWFAGASVDLMEGGNWVEAKEVEVFAYDSGGDTGATYEASDADANPKQPTMLSAAPHFMKDGQRIPVGRVAFRRVP
jgi:hypothetical protein